MEVKGARDFVAADGGTGRVSRKRDARRRGVRIVHTADIHLDSTFAQARVGSDLGQRLRSATREAFKRVLALVKSEQAHALIIAGDLYDHEYVTPDTGAFLVEAFAALGDKPVIIAPGNHDPYLPDSLYARLDWPPNVHIFKSGVPETVLIEEAGLVVHGFGHRDFEHKGRLVEGFRPPSGDEGLVHVAAAHGADISRVPPGKETCAPFQPADLLQIEASGTGLWVTITLRARWRPATGWRRTTPAASRGATSARPARATRWWLPSTGPGSR